MLLAQLLLHVLTGLLAYWAVVLQPVSPALHAGLGLLGGVYLPAQAILAHSLLAGCSGAGGARLLHALLQLAGAPCLAAALLALPALPPPLTTPHAWTGAAALLATAVQLLLGLVSLAAGTRHPAIIPLHRSLGLSVFFLAVATAISGLAEAAAARLPARLDGERLLLNCAGLLLAILTVIIPCIVGCRPSRKTTVTPRRSDRELRPWNDQY